MSHVAATNGLNVKKSSETSSAYAKTQCLTCNRFYHKVYIYIVIIRINRTNSDFIFTLNYFLLYSSYKIFLRLIEFRLRRKAKQSFCDFDVICL